MEFVRDVIDSKLLETVISLPKSLQSQRVELIVLPVAERSSDFLPVENPGLRGKYKGVFSTEKYFAQKQADKELEL